ncbi:hypothetical protein HXX76_009517 [Chlamydomonas incerta]|uniref:Uncharacterized protein n=1 Tax=Chlamydomonas incerta TaxID=51695 RepID=A0A835VZD4_CHLIN|nr:hypothetical protein HXX76_009517 [Chlamydomonas incerta]|eukprot:KAG2431503.1 hypothetical protein HXX76_009517 [Chlamydomonas incerta]
MCWGWFARNKGYASLQPSRKGRSCSAVYLDAVDRLPYNAYTSLVALVYAALYAPSDFGSDQVWKYTGPHSVVMHLVAGMTEIPFLGGLVNAAEMAATAGGAAPAAPRRHLVSVAAQQALVSLGCLFIQVALPASMLLEWVQEGAASFNDLFDVPADVPLNQPAVLLVSKSVASAYVLYWIHRRDATCALYLLVAAHHLGINRCRTAALLAGCTAVSYMAGIALAYLVTLVVIARCANPQEVVLSGAGALFILDVDDVLTLTSEGFFDSIKALMKQDEEDRAARNAAEDAEAGLLPAAAAAAAAARSAAAAGDEAAVASAVAAAAAEDEEIIGDEPSDYPLVWLGFLFVLALVSFWMYFLYRLHIHPERQADPDGEAAAPPPLEALEAALWRLRGAGGGSVAA